MLWSQSGSSIQETCHHLHQLVSPVGVLLPGTSQRANSAPCVCEKWCIKLLARMCSHQNVRSRKTGGIGLGQGTRGSMPLGIMRMKMIKNHRRMHALVKCETIHNGHGQVMRHGIRQKLTVRETDRTSSPVMFEMITGRGRCM